MRLTGGQAKNSHSATPKAAIQSIDLSFIGLAYQIACSHCLGIGKSSSTALKLTPIRFRRSVRVTPAQVRILGAGAGSLGRQQMANVLAPEGTPLVILSGGS